MTEIELQALLDLLNRTPMTRAEQLWVQALVNLLMAEIKERANEEEEMT